MKRTWFIPIITIMLFCLTGCTAVLDQQSNNQEMPDTDQLKTAQVVDIVDGDTIDVKLNDEIITVRLLLVDTPETHHPEEPIQPYGPEATAFAQQTLSGKTVKIDIGKERWGRYHRLLAYIFVDGKLYNEILVKKGLARVAYVYPPNIKYLNRLRDAEESAKKANRGIWKIDGYVRDDGFYEEVTDEGNQKQTEPDRDCDYFKTHDEAQAFFESTGGPEQDPHRLDRDGDGFVCEGLP